MNWEPWAIAALGLLSGATGWFVSQMWSALKELRTDLDSLRVYLAQTYPTYDRLTEAMRPVLTQLDRIESALVHKADKP